MNKNPFTEICQAVIGFVVVVFMLIGFVAVVFMLIGMTCTYIGAKGDPIFSHDGLRCRAIEKEFAHYDTKTGVFTWDNEDVMYVIQGPERKNNK